MSILILGVLLWVAGHLWNRFLPDLYARSGKAAYGISAGIILTALGLMILGYQRADYIHLWVAPSFLTHLNNLLMLVAIYTYFATATPLGTAWVVGKLRHPQLTGFKIWAVAHLMVNGDLGSLILFGGLLGWAVLEVILINRQGEKFDRSKAPLKSPWAHLALAGVAFVVVAGIHTWLGVSPFGA